MRLALALGVALAAISVSAYAQQNRVVIMHGGPGHMGEIDANHDGWITRQEASAQADRMFAELDSNNDGKLDDSDRDSHMHEMRMHGPEAGPDGPMGEGCTRTVDPPNATAGQDRRVTIVCNNDGHTENRVFVTRDDDNDADADAHGEHGERHIDRQVIIRGPDGVGVPGVPPVPPVGPMPPMPPTPPHPPMFMMFMSNSDEFDRNHDGALSRDEFRAQQLAFFDASDGNHDGRIRFEPPPEPPQPPTPPEPPQPPQPPR